MNSEKMKRAVLRLGPAWTGLFSRQELQHILSRMTSRTPAEIQPRQYTHELALAPGRMPIRLTVLIDTDKQFQQQAQRARQAYRAMALSRQANLYRNLDALQFALAQEAAARIPVTIRSSIAGSVALKSSFIIPQRWAKTPLIRALSCFPQPPQPW